MDLSIYVLRKLREFMRWKMTRKRDINDWLLWLMVFRIFMDLYGWKSLLLCLVGAVMIYMANRVIDEKMEVEE